MNKIIIDKPMSQMTRDEQEVIWKLSRDNVVYERDINGDLWQILDYSNGEEENVNFQLRLKKDVSLGES